MAENGICVIKSEFVIAEHNIKEVALECISEKDKAIVISEAGENSVEADQEPDRKKQRLSKKEKKKLRGQNKARPAPFRQERGTQLCNVLIDIASNEEKKICTKEHCEFLHDTEEYRKNKPKDINDYCYNYDAFGRCSRGLTCRFASKHLTDDGFNQIDEEKYKLFKNKDPPVKNHLSYELMASLRKRTYDFSASEKAIAKVDAEKKYKLENGGANSGVVTDEDVIKLRLSEKKKIDWTDKLYLSPLTTVGNLPFRRICKQYGADITCGEMAICLSLLRVMTPEWALVKRHESEDIFGVQICGNNPYIISKTAQMLQENTDIDFIDINLGCPIDLVYKEGAGCGLLRRHNVLESVVRSTSEVLNIPLTLKTRTGVYSNQNIAHTLIPKFKDWGASMITLHGRSREQRYTRLADWEYINECAGLAAPIPLFGNGDILSYEDYSNAREKYKNVSGIMIGRGALVKPWIFTEIKEQKLIDISSGERFEIIKKYTNYGLEHWGSDTRGVETTRRFLLEWLSFLYRYVPVGLLERPPQKINERPPTYRGRDDLETLMASPCCTDWIKISEMLLGPVPENFRFLPKHKANSYK